MKEKVIISRKSVFDNYTVASSGTNWSSIFDKLVRLSAKVTESYAGDILIWTHALLYEQERPVQAAFLFGFRENGIEKIDCSVVSEIDTVLAGKTIDASESSDLRMSLVSAANYYQQHWLLICKKDGSATLIRVSLHVQ